MRIFKRLLHNRIREIVEITVNKAGFVKNCGTTDAMQPARLLMKKHHKKHRRLYIAFLDLEKAFDHVRDELIWYALRQHLVSEEFVRWVQLLRHDPKRKVGSVAGVSKPLTSHSKNDLEQLVQKWNDRLMQHSLRLNLNQTEFLTTHPHETGTVTVSGSDLPRTERFKYLGSTLSANGEPRYEVASRISATWMKWHSTTSVRHTNELKSTTISSVLSL